MPELTIKGFDNLNKQFAALTSKDTDTAMRQALSFAATPMLKAVKSQAPVGKRSHKTYRGRTVAPGFLKRSQKKVVRRSKRGGRAFVFIWADKEAFYGTQFVIRGTKRKAPNNYVKRGYDQSEGVVDNRFSTKFNERLIKIANMRKN